jgi:hypothetical protein
MALGAECHGKPKPNAAANTYPINTAEPTFVKSVKNGKLFTMDQGNTTVSIVHIYGTPYELGYAQGQLMGSTAKNFVDDVYIYIEQQVAAAANGSKELSWLPKELVEIIALHGLDFALDLTVDATAKYTPDYFTQELKGLAAASGVDFKKIERIHMLGELTKGSCSMFGAWGKAVAPGYGLLQFRGLDWDMDGPFQEYTQITIYHPTQGHAFANVGFTGFIGSFSGMSSVKTGTSEIGVSFPDDTFGKESRFGIPFTYILRDMLQFDNTLADAEKRITTSHRTCDLILGFGDGKDQTGINAFRGIQYGASVANFYTDTNMMPNATWHPRMTNVVYYGMDWLCPGYTIALHDQLTYAYGQLTPEIAIRNVSAIEQSGDLFCSYYDFNNNMLYQSFARPNKAQGPVEAYNRPFLRLNMTEVFAVTQ